LLGFISNPENINDIRPQLIELIDTYKEVKEVPKYLLTIISVDKDLEQKMEANPNYQLSNSIEIYKKKYDKNNPASWEDFALIVKNLIDVYQNHSLPYESAEKVTSELFNKVSNDVKKELRLSQKNIFKRLNAMFLHDKITTEVDEQINSNGMEFIDTPKMKI
jgi:hypothetical protein